MSDSSIALRALISIENDESTYLLISRDGEDKTILLFNCNRILSTIDFK